MQRLNYFWLTIMRIRASFNWCISCLRLQNWRVWSKMSTQCTLGIQMSSDDIHVGMFRRLLPHKLLQTGQLRLWCKLRWRHLHRPAVRKLQYSVAGQFLRYAKRMPAFGRRTIDLSCLHENWTAASHFGLDTSLLVWLCETWNSFHLMRSRG